MIWTSDRGVPGVNKPLDYIPSKGKGSLRNNKSMMMMMMMSSDLATDSARTFGRFSMSAPSAEKPNSQRLDVLWVVKQVIMAFYRNSVLDSSDR